MLVDLKFNFYWKFYINCIILLNRILVIVFYLLIMFKDRYLYKFSLRKKLKKKWCKISILRKKNIEIIVGFFLFYLNYWYFKDIVKYLVR